MELKLYIVVNADGHYFRAKGYGGYGDTWVGDIQKAKIYTKISSARSTVTFFANNYPTYTAPDIHELTITSTKLLVEERKRVTKVVEKKIREKELAETRRKEWEINRTEQQMKELQEKLKELKK